MARHLPSVMARHLLLVSLAASCVDHIQAWGFSNDRNTHCAAWTKDGECDKDNKMFMSKQCAHSCGICPHLCRDVEEACAAWAKDGQCESNPNYMAKTCPTSCGLCSVRCYDKEPDCGQWARHGECEKNPAILSQCSVSCGVCSSICLDKHNDCPNWALGGDCSKNREPLKGIKGILILATACVPGTVP